MTHTQSRSMILLVLAFVVFIVGFATSTKADEPTPSRQNVEDLEDIRGNQVCIQTNRPAYDRVIAASDARIKMNTEDVHGYNAFIECKAWNISETENLSRDGWCPVWNDDSQKITLAPCEPEPVHAATDYDLDKLAKAVAMHETKDCGVNVGSALVNNCFGIRKWDKNGKPYFKKYATKEDSYKDFKRIWSSYYGRFPNWSLAKKYSGNDRPESWLANVTHYYNTL